MSQVSTIYDAVYSELSTALSDHLRLYNSYPGEIDQNDITVLRKGYGVYWGAGVPSQRYGTCQYSILRQITVTNTLETFANDIVNTRRDVAEKNLLENQRIIIDTLHSDESLGGLVYNMSFVGDSGFIKVFPDRNDVIMLQSNFEFEYNEILD